MLTLPTQPLINIGSGDDGVMSTSVSIDTAELSGGNFSDIVQVENTRI